MKAILIDSESLTVTEVEAEDINDIYRLIGCSMIEAVQLGNNQFMYVDEEGLLPHQYKGKRFYLNQDGRSYAGNALLFANGDEGETASTELTLQEARAKIAYFVTDVEPDGY